MGLGGFHGREALAEGHVYLDIILTGGELEGPRVTRSTDLDLFRGLGLAAAAGYQRGRWRADLELHANEFSALGHSDTLTLQALTINGYVDVPLGRHLAFSAGAGIGAARVDVDFGTCLDLSGCPAGAFTDAEESARAYQYSVALAWVYSETSRLYLGYRQLSTADLGLEDSLGRAYADDRLDVPMGLFGWERRL